MTSTKPKRNQYILNPKEVTKYNNHLWEIKGDWNDEVSCHGGQEVWLAARDTNQQMIYLSKLYYKVIGVNG